MATAADLAGASATDVADARQALTTFVQEQFPDTSVRAGEVADLVFGPAAVALAAVEHRATAAEASLNPEEALAAGNYDEEILATALAGRGVVRQAEATATGTVAVRFTTNATHVIPTGFQFSAVDGTLYQTTNLTTFLPTTSTVATTTDQVLVTDPATGYTGTVGVSAVEPGQVGNRPAGIALSVVTTTDATLTAAWTATDITGGLDAESDAHLLARLPAATAPRTAASAEGATGLLTAVVPAVSYTEAIGFGHAAQMRGRSVLSGQAPGRMDLRFRTADSPSRVRCAVTATLISDAPGTWRFTLDRDAAPGFFLVEKVLQTTAALTATGYVPTMVTRGFDTSDYDNPPDVRTAVDAAHSRFATAIVTFIDPDTATSGMTVDVTTRSYSAVVRTIDGIEDGQDAVDSDTAKAAGGDCLVRAAVPVLVGVAAEATTASGVTLTEDELAAAVTQAINQAGIDSQLSGAAVTARAVAILPVGTALTLSAWTGTAYPADGGSAVSLTGSTGLTVSTDRSRNLDPDTVAFYADVENVDATVT